MGNGMWVDRWEERLAALDIKAGGHNSPESGVCVMEAVAWLRNQKHNDRPVCVSPVIGTFLRNWNDNLPDDEMRNRLLKPLIPAIVDTVVSDAVELRRSYMALDWLVRVNAPAFLNLTDNLKAHAVALSGLAPIMDKASLEAATNYIEAARAAAREAAGAAARTAARAAAREAAVAAAGAAAWEAAWEAAWAGEAAGAALKSTVAQLQESAQELVRRIARGK